MPANQIAEFNVAVERFGTVVAPNGAPSEVEGVLNPACARTRDEVLLLYPRDVARGNISRIGLLRRVAKRNRIDFSRLGFALEPTAQYEVRPSPGYGCEDPRVTFVPALDTYLMAYTALGPSGPRIALASSADGFTWERLGLLRFSRPGMHVGDDKDAAFFPEPVMSPGGVLSLAFYHRPMLHLSAVDGRAAIPMIEEMPFADRESIRIGYIPLASVLRDRNNILDVAESELVMSPNLDWGWLKLGCGTPPVRIEEGWMSLYHAVDVIDNSGAKPKFRYSAGIVIHDYQRPDVILYRSPQPVLIPETESERKGTVDNVVFPTGIDPRPDLGVRTFDVYYGMADFAVGMARLRLPEVGGSGERSDTAA
ncbi:MAG: glycosidase [Candidatus Eremiobacteraeota bacterium]|nr:glycosidase [Candidatus Eremiobacteraeota bacterium]